MSKYLFSLALLLAPTIASAHTHEHTGGTGYVPFGKFTVAYDYTDVKMSGLKKHSTSDVLAKGFMMAPVEMVSQSHNFTIGYGLGELISLSATVPYVMNEMVHDDGMMKMETEANGLGDIKLGAKYKFPNQMADGLSANFGLSLPTGSIDKKDGGAKLPYMMQLGSGTVDPSIGLGYQQQYGVWVYGAEIGATFRFGENSNDYRLGNVYGASIYTGRKINDAISLKAKLQAQSWGGVKGEDSDLDPMMDPMARTDYYGGQSVDAVFGVNLASPNTALEGTNFTAEIGLPLYQKLDGIQLEKDYTFKLGVSREF